MEYYWIGYNLVNGLSRNLTIYKFFEDFGKDAGLFYSFENQIQDNAMSIFIIDFLELVNSDSKSSKILLKFQTINPKIKNEIISIRNKYKNFIDNLVKMRGNLIVHKHSYKNIKGLECFNPFDPKIAKDALDDLFILYNKILQDNGEIFVPPFEYPDSKVLQDLNKKWSDRSSRLNKVNLYF